MEQGQQVTLQETIIISLAIVVMVVVDSFAQQLLETQHFFENGG